MSIQFERKIQVDNDASKRPDQRDVIESTLLTRNQQEGLAAAEPVDLTRARAIVMAEAADIPINTDAYLPSAKNATDLPMPLYVRPKERVIDLVKRADEDEVTNLPATDVSEVTELTNRADEDDIAGTGPLVENAVHHYESAGVVSQTDDDVVVDLGPRIAEPAPTMDTSLADMPLAVDAANDGIGSSIDDDVDVVDDLPKITPDESSSANNTLDSMVDPQAQSRDTKTGAVEIKLTDAPIETVTPENLPIAKRWQDRIFDTAVKFLDETRAYFNPPKEPTAEVMKLRDERRKLHEDAARMFSKERNVSRDAKAGFIGREIHLAGKKYNVESFVAQGSFGATFLARDQDNVQRIVKITKPFDRSAMFYEDVIPTSEEASLATEPRAAILEVAALHKLNTLKDKNPGPALIDAQFVPHPDNHDQRLSVIVMEYVPGVSLTQFMAEHADQPLDVIEAVTQITDKLQVAHKAGIVHSDIKPANIVVTKDASGVSAKLIDFGAALIQKLRVNPKEVNLGKGDEVIDFGQDGNSPKRAMPSKIDRLLGKKPAQKPVYAQEANTLLSPLYSPAEVASAYRDRYSLGRTIQVTVFGHDVARDPARMAAAIDDLPYPKLQLARIAEQLTRSKPRDRITLEQTRKLLEELKTTEAGIEAIQDQLPV